MMFSRLSLKSLISSLVVWFLSFSSSSFFFVDSNQALRLCLGTTATGAEYGAVSALSINHDCSRLLCGFAKGQVYTLTLSLKHKCTYTVYIHIKDTIIQVQDVECHCGLSEEDVDKTQIGSLTNVSTVCLMKKCWCAWFLFRDAPQFKLRVVTLNVCCPKVAAWDNCVKDLTSNVIPHQWCTPTSALYGSHSYLISPEDSFCSFMLDLSELSNCLLEPVWGE